LQKAIVIPILTDWLMTAAQGYVEGIRLDYFGNIIYEDVWLKK